MKNAERLRTKRSGGTHENDMSSLHDVGARRVVKEVEKQHELGAFLSKLFHLVHSFHQGCCAMARISSLLYIGKQKQ